MCCICWIFGEWLIGIFQQVKYTSFVLIILIWENSSQRVPLCVLNFLWSYTDAWETYRPVHHYSQSSTLSQPRCGSECCISTLSPTYWQTQRRWWLSLDTQVIQRSWWICLSKGYISPSVKLDFWRGLTIGFSPILLALKCEVSDGRGSPQL